MCCVDLHIQSEGLSREGVTPCLVGSWDKIEKVCKYQGWSYGWYKLVHMMGTD